MPIVTLRVVSDDPSPVLISDIVVEVYNTSGVFQTSGITDSDGECTFLLPDGSYDVLFYKVGLSILPKQPQRIIVDTLLSNTFETEAHVKIMPESTDPRRCTVSGFILGVDGLRAKSRLVFEPVKTLTILDGAIVAPYSSREVDSTDDGYFEFELLRDTKYSAYFVFPEDLFGCQPGRLDVITPDLPGVGLDVLLFPIPINLTFSSLSISLISGGALDDSIDVELSFSDGSVRESMSSPWAGVHLTNSNSDVVEASIADAKKLRLKPIAPGTATLTTIRTMSDVAFFDPLQSYTTDTVIVTVT